LEKTRWDYPVIIKAINAKISPNGFANAKTRFLELKEVTWQVKTRLQQ
jgi:hypothetical protein